MSRSLAWHVEKIMQWLAYWRMLICQLMMAYMDATCLTDKYDKGIEMISGFGANNKLYRQGI